MQVNILEAKNRLSELIKSAQAGKEVVIANRGEPVAKLVPVKAPSADAGNGRDILDWLDRNPMPKHARRSPEQIEAGIETERDSWD